MFLPLLPALSLRFATLLPIVLATAKKQTSAEAEHRADHRRQERSQQWACAFVDDEHMNRREHRRHATDAAGRNITAEEALGPAGVPRA
jgi:hypothetical protein